ncbi:MAG: hypothetical protein Fur0042_20200 [Cyanophyceae cyanobacterium]
MDSSDQGKRGADLTGQGAGAGYGPKPWRAARGDRNHLTEITRDFWQNLRVAAVPMGAGLGGLAIAALRRTGRSRGILKG